MDNANNSAPDTLIDGPKVGDILTSSWGYEQTNVSWYEVVAVTAKSVRIVKIDGMRVESSDQYNDHMVPVPGLGLAAVARGERGTLKRVQKDSTRRGYSVSISSYETARLWDGTAQRQTGWGYGH